MKLLPGRSRKLALVVIALLVGCWGVTLWNKSDFCRGWGSHYQAQSIEYEAKQLGAIADQQFDDAAAWKTAARRATLISEKYFRVARNPLLPYPKAPLITDAELAVNETKQN